MTNRTVVLIVLGLAATIAGCNKSSPGPSTTGTANLAPAAPVVTSPPAKPAIASTLVDRVGRSAITSALISPLDAAARPAELNAYNRAGRNAWGTFGDNIRASLGVYDSLDAVCGNQILYDPDVVIDMEGDAEAQADMAKEAYQPLTDALADDRLYVNSASGACVQYFAVELNATGLVANDDCGGRTPNHDTVDVSYTALSNDLSLTVGDGVASDNAAHSDDVFPFLADPSIDD